VEHGVGYYLTGLKCKPNLWQKKSIALIRLNIFFLCVNSRITSNIFKTCFRQSEQHVLKDENLVTILRFEIQISTFVFLNL